MPNYSRQELVDPPINDRWRRCTDMLRQIAAYHELAGNSAGQVVALKLMVYLQTEHVGRISKAFEDMLGAQRDLLRAQRAAAIGQRPLAHDVTALPDSSRHPHRDADHPDALSARAWYSRRG